MSCCETLVYQQKLGKAWLTFIPKVWNYDGSNKGESPNHRNQEKPGALLAHEIDAFTHTNISNNVG